MRNLIYKSFSFIIKKLFKGLIISKKFVGYNKKLFYEIDQHLSFFFQREIIYEPEVFKVIEKLIKKNDLVFDIGANIGQYSMCFSELASNGKILSFEPDFKNFSYLNFNKNINKCENINLLNFGLGNKNETLTYFRDTVVGGRTSSFKKEYVYYDSQIETDLVEVKTLDNIINEFGTPNFIKIDVEGYEWEVVQGLSINLTDCIFLIEVRNETKELILKYFNSRSYFCYSIKNDLLLINNDTEISGFANLIFSKNQIH